MTETTTGSVARQVRELARVHHVTDARDEVSCMAVTLTRLAGDMVELDTIERLLINLKKKGVLTKTETLVLQRQYVLEKRSSGKKRSA